MQQNIFNFIYEDFKIDKPLYLIELFAGYGSQALALKYLGKEFVHHKICEWAIKSIQAYNDIHIQDYTDYSRELDINEIRNYLLKKGISVNYNEPMSENQIKRLSEKQTRTIYNNIIATHNLVNIQQVKGDDLDIHNTNLYTYLLTYSFPCQDLSLVGVRKGMEKDSGTRSGMLWEVERILKECKELPQILLMENVPQVHSEQDLPHFIEWQLELEKLGYTNYWTDLNAKNYGIPQNRNRCFMISILGDYYYEFPKPIELKLRLKDMLETEVDEKYYLSELKINQIASWGGFENPLKDIDKEKDVIGALTTHCGKDSNGMKLVGIPIKNATKQGYLFAEDGDGIDIGGRMEYHRGNVQKGMAQTITTSGGDSVGVVVKDTENYIEWQQDGLLDIDCRAFKENTIAPTTTTPKSKVLLNNLRIRRLTPKECWRLMGVRDEDFDKCSKNQSDSSLYHLAGDSIVVDVLMAIFKQLF